MTSSMSASDTANRLQSLIAWASAWHDGSPGDTEAILNALLHALVGLAHEVHPVAPPSPDGGAR